MLNKDNHIIPLFEGELNQIKDFIEIALNITFFHRLLSENEFEDVTSELSDISYVKVKNENANKLIKNTISQIENNFEKINKQKLILNFYSEKIDTNNLFESWNFLLILNREKKEIKKEEIEDKMRKYIFKIIENLNDNKSNLTEDISSSKIVYSIDINKDLSEEDYLSFCSQI